jgi:hypothetical protein
MNKHYKNRYDKFIHYLKNNTNRTIQGYTEIHHIQPRCLKGSNLPSNLIELSLREHFLAHWLLWKAYPNYLPLASAFLQMNHKNPKLKEFQGRISSRTYEKLKTETYKMIGELNTDKVNVRDANGQKLRISKEDYKNSNYKFHTTGKIYVLDTFSDKWVYIESKEYQENKDRYKSRMSLEGFPRPGNPSPIGNSNAAIDVNFCKYHFLDQESQEIFKITKTQARERNKEYGYKRLKQLQKKKVKCIDDLGNIVYISLNDYDPNIHNHYSKNTVNVFDLEHQCQTIISCEEYYLNKNRYLTSTKGKVLAKDLLGNQFLIKQDEFKSGGYVGQTKGLRTVLNKETGIYQQIDQDEYQKNKEKYIGPNQGKVNVINKFTGERKQIPKSDFDKDIYCGLGNKKYLFLCRNKLTLKEKYINIYEWNLVKDQYEIIDQNKFKTILDFI